MGTYSSKRTEWLEKSTKVVQCGLKRNIFDENDILASFHFLVMVPAKGIQTDTFLLEGFLGLVDDVSLRQSQPHSQVIVRFTIKHFRLTDTIASCNRGSNGIALDTR